MSSQAEWKPPRGAIELADEPDCWEAPNGSVYVDPVVWEQWETPDVDGERDAWRWRREQNDRRRLADYDRLRREVSDLEMALYVSRQASLAAAEALRDAAEQLTFVEGLLSAVLAER